MVGIAEEIPNYTNASTQTQSKTKRTTHANAIELPDTFTAANGARPGQGTHITAACAFGGSSSACKVQRCAAGTLSICEDKLECECVARWSNTRRIVSATRTCSSSAALGMSHRNNRRLPSTQQLQITGPPSQLTVSIDIPGSVSVASTIGCGSQRRTASTTLFCL